jgi:hypothetical protein|tara:strand:- start:761 stop:979 length:219 start_codon:yes stop_codon:yes gene_type:complete
MVSFSFLLPCALCRGLQQHWQRGLLSLVFSGLPVSGFKLFLMVLLICIWPSYLIPDPALRFGIEKVLVDPSG